MLNTATGEMNPRNFYVRSMLKFQPERQNYTSLFTIHGHEMMLAWKPEKSKIQALD